MFLIVFCQLICKPVTFLFQSFPPTLYLFFGLILSYIFFGPGTNIYLIAASEIRLKFEILPHTEIVKLVLERLWQRPVIVVSIEDISDHFETSASSVQHFLYFRWKRTSEDPVVDPDPVDQLGLAHHLVPLGSH